MNHVASQSSSVGPLTEVAPDPTQSLPFPTGRRLGYSYDPIPSAIRADRRLKPLDSRVLAVLLSFAIWRKDSCWTTISTIAARLFALRVGRNGSVGVCDRTVQRSIGRLIKAGYIRRDRVTKPDPDDPRNLTGYRYYFLFVPHQATDDQSLPFRPSDLLAPVAPPSLAHRSTGETVEPGPGRSPIDNPSARGTANRATVMTGSTIQPTITTIKGDRSEAASSESRVTSKSPDSLVTQDRDEIREKEPTFNVGPNDNVASPEEEQPASPEPTISPDAESSYTQPAVMKGLAPEDPPPAALSADDIAEAIARVRSGRRDPSRKLAYWALEESGHLPPDLAGLFPSRAPARPPRRQAAEPEHSRPPRNVVSPPKGPPTAPTTEDLIRQLPSSPGEAPARAKEVATRLAKRWGDPDSLHGFIPKLLRAARGEIPITAVLKAFRKAKTCGPDAVPGAIFHYWLNAAAGRAP